MEKTPLELLNEYLLEIGLRKDQFMIVHPKNEHHYWKLIVAHNDTLVIKAYFWGYPHNELERGHRLEEEHLIGIEAIKKFLSTCVSQIKRGNMDTRYLSHDLFEIPKEIRDVLNPAFDKCFVIGNKKLDPLSDFIPGKRYDVLCGHCLSKGTESVLKNILLPDFNTWKYDFSRNGLFLPDREKVQEARSGKGFDAYFFSKNQCRDDDNKNRQKPKQGSPKNFSTYIFLRLFKFSRCTTDFKCSHCKKYIYFEIEVSYQSTTKQALVVSDMWDGRGGF